MKKLFKKHKALKFNCAWKILLIMKLTGVLLLAGLLQVSAKGLSQNVRVNLEMENAPIEEFMAAIENQTDYRFVYLNETVKDKLITIKAINTSVTKLLERSFSEAGLKYQILDKLVIIKPDKISGEMQQIVVTGKVTDENGEPLPGVSISLKGTTRGTITNLEGEYTIEVDDPSTAVLVFSFVGYISQEINVGDQTTINISMNPDILGLEEVVVVGYGTIKKSDLTGAISSFKGESLTMLATSKVVEALQGRAPGVSIIKQSGRPGDGVKVRIRGIGTINQSDPLYVIDGIPSSNMDNVEANDILSIEILKDASSTAIYGSRGANGVVMVTTKTGSLIDDPIFSVNSYYSFDNVEQIELTKGYENAQLFLEAVENDGKSFGGDVKALFDDAIANKTIGTNWQDAVFQTGVTQNHQISIMGGLKGKPNQSLKYYLSTSFNDQKGTVKYTDFKRYNFLSKLDFSFNKNIKLGLDVNYTNSENIGFRSDQFFLANAVSQSLWPNPLMPIKMEDGTWGDMWLNQYHQNSAQVVERYKHLSTNNTSFGTRGWLEVYIIEGLSLKTIFNYSKTLGHTKDYSPSYYVNAAQNQINSTLNEFSNESKGWYWNSILTYEKKFANIHDITFMLGHEATYRESYGFGINATAGVLDDELLRYINRATAWGTPQATANETGMESFFGRITYLYDDKYILNAIVRRDGSYKFISKNKWGTFPSIGLAWKASEESFIKSLGIFDNLKLRANWGHVGNEASAGAYSYLSSINISNMWYSFDGSTAFLGGIATDTPNYDLKWEYVESSNIGADMGFLNNKLSISADYYIRNTKDMIIQVPTPAYTSNSDPFINIGNMRNKGFEFNADYIVQLGDFSYNIGANISFNNNEVKSLGDRVYIEGGRVPGDINPYYITRTEVGEEVGYFIGYEYAGIYTSQAEIDASGLSSITLGDAKFIDQNDDGVLDADDYIKLGSPHPDFTYGIHGSGKYKGFDLAFNIIGSQGNEIVNPMIVWLSRGRGLGGLLPIRMDRYHPENNPTGTQPRMTINDPNGNYVRMSNLLIEDGSYLKIKTIQLGYTLPKSIVSKINIAKCRLYVTGQNLLTFTNYSGYDPEIAEYRYDNPNNSLAQGIDLGNYPIPKTFIMGVNITF